MVGRIDKGDTLVERISESLEQLIELNPNDVMINLVIINGKGIQRSDEFKKMYGNSLKSADIDESLKRFSSDLYKRVESYRTSISNMREAQIELQYEEDYQEQMPFTD